MKDANWDQALGDIQHRLLLHMNNIRSDDASQVELIKKNDQNTVSPTKTNDKNAKSPGNDHALQWI